jgi:neurocan core protein
LLSRKLNKLEPFVDGIQPTDPRIRMDTSYVDGQTIGTLHLENLVRSDDGLYGCTARNEGGEAYVNGHLEVQFPPTFTGVPNVDIYYSWNDNPVNLSCIAESIPNATIRWYFGSNLYEAYRNRNLRVFGEGPISVLQVRTILKRILRSFKK